jgi:hypothetical protein
LVTVPSAIPLHGQSIKGVVRDASSGSAIADASVVLLDDKGRIQRGALTEADGSFVILCPKAGRYVIRVGALGFDTKDTPEFEIEAEEVNEISILLGSDTEGGPPGFEARRARGEGQFLTREDIDRVGPDLFTRLMQYVPGVTIVPLPPKENTSRPLSLAHQAPRSNIRDSTEAARGGRARYYTIRIKPDRATAGVAQLLEGTGDCVPVLWVDGKWWGPIDDSSDLGPDGKFDPSDIEAIEIYNHPSVLPDQFNSGKEAEDCGVVVLWMRRDDSQRL